MAVGTDVGSEHVLATWVEAIQQIYFEAIRRSLGNLQCIIQDAFQDAQKCIHTGFLILTLPSHYQLPEALWIQILVLRRSVLHLAQRATWDHLHSHETSANTPDL